MSDYFNSMDFSSGVSASSKNFITNPNDSILTPQPLRINKRKRQDSIGSNRGSGFTSSSLPPLKVPKQRQFRSMAQPDVLGSRSQSNPLPQGRQPSIKHRLLSRVMSSLISRPGSRRQSADSFPSPNTVDQPPDGRVSFSTDDTGSSLDTDSGPVIAAFPMPPMSNRALCAPADIAVVRPDITVTPEAETLHPDTNQSMHIAIQIGAVAEVTTGAQHGRRYGIDMAIVIDNSLYASPATLVASCETARFLSSLLDRTNDRMTIICTSSMSTEHPDLRTILPLSLPNARKAKAAVDSIVSSSDRPGPSTLDAAIRSARALLGQSTPRDRNSELSPFAFGHIFVLTSNSSGIAPELLTDDTIQLHLICAGSVPWKDEDKIRCNGWKMQSMHSKELQSVSYLKDDDPSSLFNRLRTTIVDARKGCLHGTVSDLVLDIKAGQNCAIEGVIGTRNIPSLQRGENFVALVKLKVGLPPAAGYTFNARRQRDASNPESLDIDQEINTLLGTTPVTVLKVKLRYNHSLLPPDTQCTISTDCRLKRRLYTSIRQDTAPSRAVVLTSKQHSSTASQIEVHKRFAFHIATHHAPRQAMTVLIEDFGDGGRRSACPAYIKLLIEELKYQARTIERFDLAEHRSSSLPVIVSTARELRPDVWGVEHFGHGLFDAVDYRPQEWITGVPDDEIMVVSPPPSSSLSSLSSSSMKVRDQRHHRSHSGETTNRTVVRRKRQQQPKKRQSSHAGASGGSENWGPVSTTTTTMTEVDVDAATKRLRDLALREKRSVGAETFKYFGLLTEGEGL
ncbi:MAG: hypothetical protein Q9197_000436 [Variospora fuerteventurae]